MSIVIYLVLQFFIMGAVSLFHRQIIIATGMSEVFPLLFMSQVIFSGLIWVTLKAHAEQCRIAAGLPPDKYGAKAETTTAEMFRYVVVLLGTMVIGSAFTVARYPEDRRYIVVGAIVIATVIGGFLGLGIRKGERIIQRATAAELNSRTEAEKASGQTVPG